MRIDILKVDNGGVICRAMIFLDPSGSKKLVEICGANGENEFVCGKFSFAAGQSHIG